MWRVHPIVGFAIPFPPASFSRIEDWIVIGKRADVSLAVAHWCREVLFWIYRFQFPTTKLFNWKRYFTRYDKNGYMYHEFNDESYEFDCSIANWFWVPLFLGICMKPISNPVQARCLKLKEYLTNFRQGFDYLWSWSMGFRCFTSGWIDAGFCDRGAN